MGVAVEIEAREIRDRLGRACRRHFARPHQSAEALRHFHVYQVGGVELVCASEQSRLDPRATRGLQQELQQG